MDKLTAIRTFVTVVSRGSFSRAAQTMSVPKTRVSQRIQELEAQLSTRLLYRTTRTVSLTEEGRLYYEKCLHILEEIDAVEQSLRQAGEMPTGRLRVSTMSLIGGTLLLPQLSAFRSAFPNVSLTLSLSDRIENLNEAGWDCAIRGGSLQSSSLISKHLCDVTFGLYAAPAWLRDADPIESPDALQGASLIKMVDQRDGSVRAWDLTGPAGAARIDGRGVLEIDDDKAALDAALHGCGIVLAPDFAARPHVKEERLEQVLPQWRGVTRPIYAIYPTRRHLSAKLRSFLGWAETVIRDRIENREDG